MAFDLFQDLLAVTVEEVSETTDSGLYLVPTAQNPIRHAIVHASGPGRYDNGVLIRNRVSPGDTIIMWERTGNDARIDGKDYRLVHEADILGVFYGDNYDDYDVIGGVVTDAQEGVA